jgi:GntR family transcriptional regulator
MQRARGSTEIRRAIADGEARPGEKLPPARDLAAVLGVNANTVFRALRLLRVEGLLEFRRGRGVTVTGAATERGAVLSRARDLLQFARRRGREAGSAAQRMLVEYLFATSTVHRVWAWTGSDNLAEQKALDKCGFTRERETV